MEIGRFIATYLTTSLHLACLFDTFFFFLYQPTDPNLNAKIRATTIQIGIALLTIRNASVLKVGVPCTSRSLQRQTGL